MVTEVGHSIKLSVSGVKQNATISMRTNRNYVRMNDLMCDIQISHTCMCIHPDILSQWYAVVGCMHHKTLSKHHP